MADDATGELTLLAPLTGVLVPLADVPDAAFAQRLAGDGIAIDPMGDRLVAPCDAEVLQVHRAGHAVTLGVAGLELVLHVGLDTVLLKGDGFTPAVKAGDRVKAGDVLLTFDADRVARRARSLLTMLLVANPERAARLEPATGTVRAGEDPVLRIRLAGAPLAASAATASVAGGEGTTATSSPIAIAGEAGIHARPAAAMAHAAKQFAAEVRLVKDGREANVRSLVSVMALEAGPGDSVTVTARGVDAAAAVEAVARVLTETLAREAAAHTAPTSDVPPAPRVEAAPSRDGSLRGVPASPGVAVGIIHHLRPDDEVPDTPAKDAATERGALDAAITGARTELAQLEARLAGEGNAEQGAIFAAHRELLDDPDLLERAQAGIGAGASAARAWRDAYGAQADRLLALKKPLLAGRAADLRDVGRRVLRLLAGERRQDPARAIPDGAILVAEELTPSDTATLDRAKVRGFCTTTGSATSHVAILARGMGLPAVAGIDARVLDVAAGLPAILDGDAGTLLVSPDAAALQAAESRQARATERRARELASAAEPATTRDGQRIEVVANIGAEHEAPAVVTAGGEGVGLLRTEFLFMERASAPDEDEQARTYEAIARALGPERILVIRTMDVGGDKPLAYLPMPKEENPFLGERGVRLSLARPELFRVQLRAILRASTAGKVAVMFPMISTLAEWRAARDLLEAERAALGVRRIPTGIMVETAAAAIMADQFAREADFLSIGTNDLTQYTLAMDRGNARLAPQVDALNPAVLRLIERTVAGAREHGRWVGVCGALAGDLTAVPVLVGLGVTELSADVPLVPAVRARVRTLSLAECRATAQAALAAEDGAAVRALVAARHG